MQNKQNENKILLIIYVDNHKSNWYNFDINKQS